jgi:superfamily II DNA or RNA helicase
METLYKYQEKPYAQVMRALEEKGRALLFMATGLGKTAVSGHIAKHYINQGARGLFLYCENEGLGQSEARFRSIIGNDVSFKRFYGTTTKDWDADQAQMLFASVQSLNNTHGKWYTIFDPNHFDFIIYDEAHHGQAPTHKEVIDYFNAKKLGMTGTPDREDDKDIRDIFGKETTNVPLARGIARGWLKQVEYHTISDGINTRKLKRILREVKSGEKRVTVKQLNESIFVQKRDRAQKDIIKSYNTIKEYSVKKRTLIFCENIDHAKSFFRQFKDNEAGLIHSKQNEKINIENLKKFRNGDLQYLLCIDKFNECIHVAGIEVIVFLRATDSKRIFLQQLGRGLAKSGLVENLIVLDFVQNVQRLVRIRELAKQIREESEKLDPNKEFDKNVFDVKGKYYDLTHVDTTIRDILNVLEAIERGFYDTLEEAKEAVNSLNITTWTEYSARYRENLRLPSNLKGRYKNYTTWSNFIGRESVPVGWVTANQIAKLPNIQGKDTKIKFLANAYRESNPLWFKDYWINSLFAEHYHPKLVSLLKKLAKRGEIAPKNWMTARGIADNLSINATGQKVELFAEKYRAKNPQWFKGYIPNTLGNKSFEHYSPELVNLIKEHYSKRIPPKGWMTTYRLSVELNSNAKTIRPFANTYRAKNPQWFRDYFASTKTTEHYSPRLVKLIKEHYLKRKKAPRGWMTATKISSQKDVRAAHQSITIFAQNYHGDHPEWFGDYWTNYNNAIHYHPNLVKLIKDKFNKR